MTNQNNEYISSLQLDDFQVLLKEFDIELDQSTQQRLLNMINSEKERMCPKALPFKQSFALRCLLAILKWNDPMHWYQELMDHVDHVQLNEKCMNILALDAKVRAKARDKARLENSKIARNKKRKEERIKNRIDPNGHQYLSLVQKKQEEAKERGDRVPTIGSKRDPLRFVALSKLPHISNLSSNNCFINSVLQLLKQI